MTFRDLIERACQDINVIGGGDVLGPDDAQLGLDRLNDWIDALALDGLTIPSISRATWTIVSGTASYTVGSGSTVNVAKPVSPQAIQNIGYQDTSATTPTEILFGRVLTDQEYEAVPQKTLTGSYPTSFWYDKTTGITGTLKPFPIPTLTTLQGVIYTPAALSEVALADTVALPKGYRRFFRTNLTVELAAAFEKQVPESVRKLAAESMEKVKTSNLRAMDMGFGLMVPGLSPYCGYDINSDQ